jgi:hypothetical protein
MDIEKEKSQSVATIPGMKLSFEAIARKIKRDCNNIGKNMAEQQHIYPKGSASLMPTLQQGPPDHGNDR